MVREVVKARCGVNFDKTAAAQWNIEEEDLKPPSLARTLSGVTVYEGSTTEQDPNCDELFNLDDALEDKGDKLILSPENLKGIVWWALELSPTFYEWQDEHGKWWKQLRRVPFPVSRTLRSC